MNGNCSNIVSSIHEEIDMDDDFFCAVTMASCGATRGTMAKRKFFIHFDIKPRGKLRGWHGTFSSEKDN